MKIVLIVEGRTEKAFLPHLRSFLGIHLSAGTMPRIDTLPCDGRIPTKDKLRRVVENLLTGPKAADHVVALTDVYTGTRPPDFQNGQDAIAKMRSWVGPELRFHPHVAQYDFEAWLLPYWPTIQRLAQHNRAAPAGNPEMVNHTRPPAYRIQEVFEAGGCRDSYIKPTRCWPYSPRERPRCCHWTVFGTEKVCKYLPYVGWRGSSSLELQALLSLTFSITGECRFVSPRPTPSGTNTHTSIDGRACHTVKFQSVRGVDFAITSQWHCHSANRKPSVLNT